MRTREFVAKLNLNLRDKPGISAGEFIERYCDVFSKYAYATRDGSLNEFEKEITHVLGMMIYYKRFCEIMGFRGEGGKDFDPRYFVWAFESKQEEMLAEKEIQAKKYISRILNETPKAKEV